MTEPLELCSWCEREMTGTSLCERCFELLKRHADAAGCGDQEAADTAWHEARCRLRPRRDQG